MAVWTAPTGLALVTELKIVLRDDDTPEVFTYTMCQQFLDDAIVELNQLRPREQVGTIDASTDLTSELAARIDDVWKVEWEDPDGYVGDIIPASDGSSPGWLYYANRMRFDGQTMRRIVEAVDNADPPWRLRWYGYQFRGVFPGSGSSTTYVDIDNGEDESLLLRFARWSGLRSLGSDRSLFQQWQQQTNNSDVSATQLTQMTAMAENEWDQLRKRLTRVRRPAVGAT